MAVRVALLLLVCAQLRCQDVVRIEVALRGTPAGTSSVRVTAQLDGVPALGAGQFLSHAATAETFRVELPSSASGRLRLSAKVQDESGCDLASGQSEIDIAGPGTYAATLETQPQVGCALSVELVGKVSGRVTSLPSGIDCGTSCTQRYAHGQVVTLTSQTTNLFGGWYTDETQTRCAGRQGCTITIGSGVTRLRASYLSAGNCATSKWCHEVLDGSDENIHLHAIWGNSRDDVWAVGDGGVILRGDGINWTRVASPTSVGLRSVFGSSESDVWLSGEQGTLLHYDGRSLTQHALPVSYWLNGVWASASNDVWIVGDAGHILHYDGQSFSEVSSGTMESLRGIWGSSAQDIWAVGDAGTVLRFAGSDWTAISMGLSVGSLYAVWGTGEDNVYMVGAKGVVLRWTGMFPLLPIRSGGPGLHSIWGASRDEIWIGGEANTLLLSTGSAFFPVTLTTTSPLIAAIWGSGRRDVWAVGFMPPISRYRP